MKRGYNRSEPDDLETLDMSPKFIHEHNAIEHIRIAVLPDQAECASFVFLHYDKAMKQKYIQVCPDIDEIDIIIDALQEAKRRMIEYRGSEE